MPPVLVHTLDVACPDCGAEPSVGCTGSLWFHDARVEARDRRREEEALKARTVPPIDPDVLREVLE